MKCKNCGTENQEKEQYCKKCGKSLYELTFKEAVSRAIFNPNWLNVGLGVAASFIVLAVFYGFMDAFDTFVYGMMPALLVGVAVTSILFRNKNVRAGYDYFPILSGAVTGLIAGFVVLIAIMAQYRGSEGLILLIFIPGYTFWGLMGGTIGGIINWIREYNIKLIIPFAVILILIVAFVGYSSNQNHTNSQYNSAYSNQMGPLVFDELIQAEADSFLNKTVNTTQQKITNLKEAQKRYQRMVGITKVAQSWNKQMVDIASSDVEKEYANALGQYVDLKYDYYNEMNTGIQLAIAGNEKEAQMHYQNAKNLMPHIKSQEKTLSAILNKDSTLKKSVDEELSVNKEAAEQEKQKGELMTFTFLGPDS